MPNLVDLGIDHLAPLDVAHLQFDPRTEGQLRGYGLYTIGDLDTSSTSYQNVPYSLDEIISNRLELIAEHTDEFGTVWSAAWKKLAKGPFNFAFSQRPLSHCSECGSTPLKVLRYRVGRILNIPIHVGYENLNELLVALERTTTLPSSFGKGKMIQLSAMLERELRQCSKHHDNNIAATDVLSLPSLELEALQKKRDIVQQALNSISLDALGLGKKTDYFKQQGWTRIGDLPPDLDKIIFKISGLGRKTAERALFAKSNLVKACVDGAINRQIFADLEGVPIIPTAHLASDLPLPELFRSTLIQAASYDDNPVTMLVVKERICQTGSDTATLEEIANMPNVGLTRERVRQVEKRYLGRVRKSLLDPWARSAGCLFTDEFRKPFVELSEAVKKQDTIGIHELVDNIEHFWNCRRKEANLLLPMIMAIIEGTARTDGNLRRLGNLPETLLRPLKRPARDWPAWNLGAGKSVTRKIANNNVADVEGLRCAWIEGLDLGSETDSLHRGLEHLGKLKLGQVPLIDDLAEEMDKPILPLTIESPTTYLANMTTELVSIIENGDFLLRSKEVFFRRSALPPAERNTIQSLADEFDVSVPNVAKTQTQTLERLYNIIFTQSAGYSGMLLRPEWLDLWTELEGLFERFYPDQRTFQRSLMTTFGAPEGIVGVSVHPIWAVLSGRTSKKSFGHINMVRSSEPIKMAPVVLRGFRSAH